MLRLILPLAILWASTLTAQEPRPVSLSLSGVVVDAEGSPRGGCELTLYAPAVQSWAAPSIAPLQLGFFPWEPVATLHTTSDSDGKWSFSIDTRDPAWLRGGKGVLVASDPIGSWVAAAYDLKRCRVDLPLRLELPAATRQRVSIRDAAGRPLAGATVSPASAGGVELPLAAARRLQAVADSEGIVTLPGCDPTIEAVYVAAESVGELRVGLAADREGMMVAATAEPRAFEFRAEFPTDAKPEALPKLRWLLWTFAGDGPGMTLSWRVVETSGELPTRVEGLTDGAMLAAHEPTPNRRWIAESLGVMTDARTESVAATVGPAIRVTGSVRSQVDGRPLPGIAIWTSPTTSGTVTGADGAFTVWFHSLSWSVFPIDPLGQYFSPDAFFERPRQGDVPGEAAVAPFELLPSADNVGTVVAPDGSPAAGVSVKCEYKQSRFTRSETTVADREGRFRFTEVASGTPVRLSVHDAGGVTPEPVEVTLSPGVRPELRLQTATPVRIAGRVLDARGEPVAGAAVAVKRGEVSIQASFGAAEYQEVDAFEGRLFFTDADGRFTTPELVDWKHPFSAWVDRDGFHSKRTTLQPVAPERISEGVFSFGDIAIRPVLEPVTKRIVVRGPDGEAAAGSRVVVIQPREGSDSAVAGEGGEARLAVRPTGGLLAASHPDFGTAFVAVSPSEVDDPDRPVAITLGEGETPLREVPDLAARRRAAADLLEAFGPAEEFDMAAASDGQLLAFALAEAITDPAAFLKRAAAVRADPVLQQRPVVGEIAHHVALRDGPLSLAVLSMLDPPTRYNLLLRKADAASDPATREALFAQAMADVRRLEGSTAALAVGRAAAMLLRAGRIAEATQLVEEIYRTQGEHAASLDSTAGSSDRYFRGLARVYYPLYALIDPPTALRLIRLHAYSHEVDVHSAGAVLTAIAAGRVGWDEGMALLGRESFGGLEKSLVPGPWHELPLPDLAFVDEFARRLPDPSSRALLHVYAAVRAPGLTQDQRRERLLEALDLLRSHPDRPADYYGDALPERLDGLLKEVEAIDHAAFRRLLFESVWDLRQVRDDRYGYIDRWIGPVAEWLGRIDPSLGRALLEPLFDEYTWMYRDYDSPRESEAFTSAARVDPAWAAAEGLELIRGNLRADPLRQAEVLGEVVEGLAEPK